MNRKYLLVLLSVAISHTVFAGACFISGKITGAISKDIALEIDYQDYDGTVETHTVQLDADNKFSFNADVDFPIIANLRYTRNVGQVYLEPGGTLHIDTDAGSFQHAFRYSGSCADGNRALKQFRQQYPVEKNMFRYTQYRKGLHTYNIEPKVSEKMRNNSYSIYGNTMETVRKSKQSSLDFYKRHYPGITPQFIDYMTAEIDYDFAYKMLAYAHVFKGSQRIPDEFNKRFEEVIPLQSNQLGSENYKKYVLGYLNWKNSANTTGVNPYLSQYNLTKDLLFDKTLAWAQAQIIVRGFVKKQFDDMLFPFKEFVDTNPYTAFDDYLVHTLEESYKISVGSLAPNFTLTDHNGVERSLTDYLGKVVYLNFWASWCRPCVQKAEKMFYLERKYEHNPNIAFLNISFDKTEDSWKRSISNRGWGNRRNVIHLLETQATGSSVAKEYQVNAIPAFFIIDSNGTFMKRPASTQIVDLEKFIDKLLSSQP